VFSWFSHTLHPFTSDRFLAIETLDWFVRLYFENFNPVYPFLDRSLLSVPSWGCCITLATAAIGANYMASAEGAAGSDALHGLLHEILTHEVRESYPKACIAVLTEFRSTTFMKRKSLWCTYKHEP
jgi:hypothetical protein